MDRGYRLFVVTFVFIIGCAAPALKDTSALPLEFKNNIPMQLRNGMALLEITAYRNIKDKSRPILYANSRTGKDEVKGSVSLLDGYRVMYGVPGTGYFAKMHVEKSVPGQFDRDRAVILGARWHNHQEHTKQLLKVLKEHDDYKAEFESTLTPGQDLLIYQDDSYKNYEYVSSHASVLGLTRNVMGEVCIFNPADEMITTLYILLHSDSKYRTMEEFELMLSDFIEGYIDYIAAH